MDNYTLLLPLPLISSLPSTIAAAPSLPSSLFTGLAPMSSQYEMNVIVGELKVEVRIPTVVELAEEEMVVVLEMEERVRI